MLFVIIESQFQPWSTEWMKGTEDNRLGLLQIQPADGVVSFSLHTDTHKPPGAKTQTLANNKEGFEVAFQEAEDHLVVFGFLAPW